MPRLPKTPKESDFRSPAHHERVTARLGLWLGVTFGICFLTGLISHALQHPPGWFVWPSRPVNLYRITQGLHVLSGIAAIPLLLAKLWSVYPKLFSRPVVRSLPHALERASILVLSGAAFFQLVTGLFNAMQNYAWRFYFPTAHYAVAWVAIGSILVHVAVKLPVIRRGLTSLSEPEPGAEDVTERVGALSRRGFLRTTALTSAAAVVATAGATVPLLRDVSPLTSRSNTGPQGVPVNRTARAAGVLDVASSPDWRLEVVTAGGIRSYALADLARLPQTTAELPIACVEGWSASATWTGVSVPELLRHAGSSRTDVDVRFESLETGSLYRASTLPATHTADPLTLLALRLNGEELDIDHGYPCRLIAPNRPGVLQTKWLARLEVLT